VERLDDKVLVTLLEGRVLVNPGEASDPVAESSKNQITLTAGQQLTLKPHARPALASANIAIATAWERGSVILSNEPLGEAVQHVNRYIDRPLTVDPTIASIPISGVFNAGDVTAFIDAVTTYFPVEANISGGNRILLQRKRGTS
jgi:transmembrane sensor